MDTIRVYKDNVRESILRSLIFTNTVVFIILAIIIAFFQYFLYKSVLHTFSWQIYFATISFQETIFFIIAMVRIDNQPIYTLLVRYVTYAFRQRKTKGNGIDTFFQDMVIQDNLIIRKNSIAKVFRITPYDISGLNDDERKQFFQEVKKTIHMLPSQIQILTRKEIVARSDITDHMLSLCQTMPKKDIARESLLRNYEQSLIDLVHNGSFLTIKEYGVLSEQVDTGNIKMKLRAIKKLGDMFEHMVQAFSGCHVAISEMTSSEIQYNLKTLFYE